MVTQSSDEEFDFFATAPPGPQPMPHPGLVGTPSHVQVRPSRWAKSDVTFGPVGRVVASVLMVLPLLFLLGTGVFTADPFEFIGAVIWSLLMVTGFRHVWQPVKLDRR